MLFLYVFLDEEKQAPSMWLCIGVTFSNPVNNRKQALEVEKIYQTLPTNMKQENID